jgi:uncharacterized protein (DUF2252 family)
MSRSPFAFYRGAARIMAADLSRTPISGILTQLCGDAHLANFGVYASPERRLVFDLNDFDETLPGPWEWDVKRLAASLFIAGRHNGLDDHKQLREIAVLRGWTLARSHARSGDAIAISSYLDSGNTFDKSITEFSARYAEQNERDYQAYLTEIRNAKLEVADVEQA